MKATVLPAALGVLLVITACAGTMSACIMQSATAAESRNAISCAKLAQHHVLAYRPLHHAFSLCTDRAKSASLLMAAQLWAPTSRQHGSALTSATPQPSLTDATSCPQGIKDLLGDDASSVEWIAEDQGCLQSNENRLAWTVEVVKDGKKTKTAHGSWNCYCSANQPTQKLKAGMYLTVYSAPLYEPCSSDGDCYGCAATCGDRGDGQKHCGAGQSEEATRACYTGAFSPAHLHVAGRVANPNTYEFSPTSSRVPRSSSTHNRDVNLLC